MKEKHIALSKENVKDYCFVLWENIHNTDLIRFLEKLIETAR